MSNYYYTKILNMEEQDIYDKVAELIAAGQTEQALSECREAMQMAIRGYERREIYLDGLLDAARIINRASALCHEKMDKIPYLGEVITCTVKDDVHQNGRLMAVSVLRACGYHTNDLGNEVPPEPIIAALQQTEGAVLALSGLVSSCIDSMKRTVEAIRAAGLDPVIIVCGGLAGEYLRAYTGAQYYAKLIPDTIAICKEHCKPVTL